MYSFIKRAFDVAFSLAALVILSPLLVPIAILLRLTGEGYVFYLQERVGKNNSTFRMYKFATMLKDSPNMAGGFITLRDDPRLTPLGGFLRRTKINELPQLLNMVKGEMSFVGPRPVMPKSFAEYPNDVQEVIYNVRPGLTGIGSIIFRDEEELITRESEAGRDPMDFYRDKIYPYKGKVELWYQANRSFWVDLKILLLTAWVIFFPDDQLVHKWFSGLPRRGF